MDMQISLFHWPPRRLVRESVLNHNLRHPEAALDEEKSPWEAIVPVIFAFVRHELTNYDEELRRETEGARDEEKRNRLASRVASRVRKAYPWITKDPRPFPPRERALELDATARQLANLRTYEYHLKAVLKDVREPKRRKELRGDLELCRAKIARLTASFTLPPPPTKDHIRVYSRPTETEGDYDWFGYSFHLNYLEYTGFTCPLCKASVMTTKRAFPFGQGQKRVFLSCYCICVATEKFIKHMTLKWWEESLTEHGLLEKPPESPTPPEEKSDLS